MHFGGLEDALKDSTAPHITFTPQLGGDRQCGLAICTFHLGFSLVVSGDLLTRRAIETVPGHGFDISLNPQDHSEGLRQLYPVNRGWDRRGRRQA